MSKTREIAGQMIKKCIGDVRWTNLRLKQGRISKNTYYDILTEMVMEKVLTSTSVCVDVGCFEGSILRLMMQYAPNGVFIAFEPIPSNYERLRGDSEFEDVQIFNLALSDTKSVTSFNYVTSNPGYSGLIKRRYDRPNEKDTTIEVQTDTLDNILRTEAVENVSFIKIDVEGAEMLVLKGAERYMKKHKPYIVFEHGLGAADCYGHKPEQVYKFLCNDCGLRISLLNDWLLGKPSLTATAFSDQFNTGKNYYFLAHCDF